MTAESSSQRISRIGPAVVFALSMFYADMIADGLFISSFYLVPIGYSVPILATWLWGERMRPKLDPGWFILGTLAMAVLVFTGLPVLAASLAVGFYLVHDLPLSPSVMLTGSTVAALVQFDMEWFRAGEQQAWLVAMTVLFGVIAAIWERDRLAWRVGRPVHLGWSLSRVAFLSLWTVSILTYREDLEVWRLFALIGADPTGFEGQMLLLAILSAALVLAGLMFRTGKRKATPANPRRT